MKRMRRVGQSHLWALYTGLFETASRAIPKDIETCAAMPRESFLIKVTGQLHPKDWFG